MAARYASAALTEIDAALAEECVEAPLAPVSCAAMLAQAIGASDLHTVMAAGLAGGIGLSGGACGVLGAAIWIISMKGGGEGDGKIGFDNPAASAAIEKFLESTGDKFECSKIVGRKFESVADHASYLREGGCAKIIEALAACLPIDRASEPTESGEKA